MKSYVYAYVLESGVPYYVGKGVRHRDTSNHHNVALPQRENIKRIKENLTDREACELEDVLIAFWGLEEEGGVLQNKNKTHNQAPNRTGLKNTAEQNANISKGRMGVVPWNKGLSGKRHNLTEETKKKISDKLRGTVLTKRKVLANGVVYPNFSVAAKALGCDRHVLGRWARGIVKHKQPPADFTVME